MNIHVSNKGPNESIKNNEASYFQAPRKDVFSKEKDSPPNKNLNKMTRQDLKH